MSDRMQMAVNALGKPVGIHRGIAEPTALLERLFRTFGCGSARAGWPSEGLSNREGNHHE